MINIEIEHFWSEKRGPLTPKDSIFKTNQWCNICIDTPEFILVNLCSFCFAMECWHVENKPLWHIMRQR